MALKTISSSNIFRHARYETIYCLWMPYRPNSTLKNPSTLWISWYGFSPPSFISSNYHNKVEDDLDLSYLYTGFECSTKAINRTKSSEKNQGSSLITSFILLCACGRKYVPTSKIKRQSSPKMTGCEWDALCIRAKKILQHNIGGELRSLYHITITRVR